MAIDAGLLMPETQLLEDQYFEVRRFDRLEEKRVHVHTLGNMVASDFRVPSLDYADLFKVVLDVTKSRVELLKAFRQMVFNIATHNRDDHSKNFAFVWNEVTEKWQFSPSYDLMFSAGVYGEHTMTVNGEGKQPSLNDVIVLAKNFDIEHEAKQIVSEVNTVISNAKRYLNDADVSGKSKQLLTTLIVPL